LKASLPYKKPWGKKYLRILIFAVFFTIGIKRFPPKKDAAKIFSAKVYSTVEIIHKHHLLQEM